MGQVLHGSATTTEAVRRAIQHSQESLRSTTPTMRSCLPVPQGQRLGYGVREPGPDEHGPGLGTGESSPLASISNEQDWVTGYRHPQRPIGRICIGRSQLCRRADYRHRSSAPYSHSRSAITQRNLDDPSDASVGASDLWAYGGTCTSVPISRSNACCSGPFPRRRNSPSST